MSIFDKLKEPIFLKESSNAYEQVEDLKRLLPELNMEGQGIIKQDIKNLEYGIAGEENIMFELKNSHIPMYVLQDVNLGLGDLSAQIDFMVFTRKICFVIECKNLYGDIEITNKGEFIRSISYGNVSKKEGIYSPITQNQRHMDLLQKIRTESQKNIIMKKLVDIRFDDVFQSVVVLANPKTCLKDKYAQKEVKNQVIRADQLITYIKEACKKSKESECSDKELEAWAKRYMGRHIESKKNYLGKYESYKQNATIVEESENTLVCPKCGGALVLRVAKRGANAGNSFYGCSNYPKCRYVQNTV